MLFRSDVNEVRFSSRAPAWKCIHQPPLLALRGRFAVVDGALANETGTIESGSWAEQGYPHYVGTGAYTWTFEAPEEAGRVFLETPEAAVVASVTLNGQRLATRLWAPYRFELTQALQPGLNTLTLEITSTSVNLLGWNDPWKLIHWQFPNGRTEGQPAGLIAPARLLW